MMHLHPARCRHITQISLVLVASAQSVGAALFGICLASVASGVGEITFLALTAKYSEVPCMGTPQEPHL